jgi:hypothetical protein
MWRESAMSLPNPLKLVQKPLDMCYKVCYNVARVE